MRATQIRYDTLPIRVCLQYKHAAVFRLQFSIRTFFLWVSREFLIFSFVHLDNANRGIVVGEHPFILNRKNDELSLPPL